MSLPAFAASRPLTLGVELELQIVNLDSLDLQPSAPALLAHLRGHPLPGQVVPEMTQSMIEISTGICANHDEVLAQLGELQGALQQAAQANGVGLCGGGTHPFQRWQERRISEAPRYAQLSELYGYLAKQFTVFGQHVHVGCPGPDQALTLLHGLSRHVPHLIALSASSPFVQRVDTGFHSARLNTVAAFPLAGRAPFALSWDAFGAYFEKMTRTGVVKGMKDFYWDIRPKPEFGTVEVRVMDTPLSIEKAAALAALVQCLARWLRVEKPYTLSEDDYLVYAFNRFQACRFGLDGTYVDPSTGEHQPLRDAVTALLDRLEVHAMELRAEGALQQLRRELLGDGNDATWLRQRHAALQGDLPALVQEQVRRWTPA